MSDERFYDGCENCDGVRCMDCRLRYVHDECADTCPTCCHFPASAERVAALLGVDVTQVADAFHQAFDDEDVLFEMFHVASARSEKSQSRVTYEDDFTTRVFETRWTLRSEVHAG